MLKLVRGSLPFFGNRFEAEPDPATTVAVIFGRTVALMVEIWNTQPEHDGLSHHEFVITSLTSM